MSGKTEKHILFEVQLNWLCKKKGILRAKDAEGKLYVATPPKFGGEGKPWTPEHYFLNAISGCFMTTYLSFAHKLGFNISNFECTTIGEIEIVDGKYKFTIINLYPKIYIAEESLRKKASAALSKTHKHSLISNSVKADIFYHSEILIAPVIEMPAMNDKDAELNY